MVSDGEPVERSPEARRLAEKGLFALVVSLHAPELPLVVLGGLVPEVLTSGQEPPAPQHLGTTDVDIHLGLGIDPELDLAPLEQALEVAGFEPDPKIDGWRWRGKVDGFIVKVEFLCELHDQPANTVVHPIGCKRLGAANLRGTGFVGEDFEWEEITGELTSGEVQTVRVRFAGLQGYVMSKAYAAWTRGLPKDYYDLTYTLLYNRLGGPREAAKALANGKFADRINTSSGPWPELGARFAGTQDIGPVSYAEQALQADPTGDTATLRQDAVGAVREFLGVLTQERSAEA